MDQDKNVSEFDFKIKEDEECLSYYRKNIKPRENELFSVADMGPLPRKAFEQALIATAPVYERDINIEIEHMTKNSWRIKFDQNIWRPEEAINAID